MNGMKRYFTYVVNHTFSAASASIVKLLRTTSEYDFCIQKIMARATTTDFTVRTINSEFQWSNSAVKADNFAGDVNEPNILLEPVRIPKNTNIELELINGATASNVIQLAFEGYLTPNMENINRQWFQYITDISFTGASEQAIRTLKISSNRNFILQKFVAKATATDYQVDIIDANEKWTQEYVRGSCLFGTAKKPNILLTPLVIMANSSITLQLINGATASNPVQLCLEGFLEGK